MVGSRNSVPKEHVYPKFDKIAQLWKDLGDELEIVTCRESTLNDLVDYKSSFTATLNSDSQILSLARDAPTLATGAPRTRLRAKKAPRAGEKARQSERQDEERSKATRLSNPNFVTISNAIISQWARPNRPSQGHRTLRPPPPQ